MAKRSPLVDKTLLQIRKRVVKRYIDESDFDSLVKLRDELNRRITAKEKSNGNR